MTTEEVDAWFTQIRTACTWGATSDPLAQYFLLAGRVGGQTVSGDVILGDLTASRCLRLDASKKIVVATGDCPDGATAGVTDHGALTGLGDDDHTQYALLAGRSGSQTANGGLTSGESFSLYANAAEHTAGPAIFLNGGDLDNVIDQYGADAYTPAIILNGPNSDAGDNVTINADFIGLQSTHGAANSHLGVYPTAELVGETNAQIVGYNASYVRASADGSIEAKWHLFGSRLYGDETTGDLTLTGGNFNAPAVSATTFTGALVGNASTATTATTASDLTCTDCIGSTEIATLTPADAGLGSVTNDAQTKAAVVPNTAPSAGQLLVGNAGGTAYAPQTMSGDGTFSSAGVLTIEANAIALGTDTTGGYAASSSEGGAATTAVAAASTPTQCSAGSYPLGVDTSWNAANCTADDDQPDSDAEVPDNITASNYAPLAGATFTGTVGVDNAQAFRLYEADANGSNYVEFVAPSALTSNTTCTLENDGNPIPDSCVGDGTDASGGISGLGSTDNLIVRTDGTGGTAAQNSLLTIPDTDALSTPALALGTDPNTGISWVAGADKVSMVAGGIEAVRANTVASGQNYVSITPGASNTGPTIAAAGAGSNLDITLAPTGTGRMMIDRIGAPSSELVLITNWRVQASEIYNTSGTGSAQIRGAISTTAAPGYSFQGDLDTGLHRPGVDQVSLVAGGFETLRANNGSVDYNGTNGSKAACGYHTEQLTLSTSGTTTDTTTNLSFDRTDVIEYRITTAVATATAFTLKVKGGNSFCSLGTATTSQTTLTVNTTGKLVPCAHADLYTASASKLTADTTGTPSAGVLRLTTFGCDFTAPTS